MRFDDSLRTVLESDSSPGLGARSTWRQLVDLAGRGRVPTDEPLIARLRMLRPAVPADVRAASARALAYAKPSARLVSFFAEDELAIAAPVLSMAELPTADWIALLPRLSPPLRSVLRRRRDLDASVARALESFGAVDFALPRPAESVLELERSMIAAPGEASADGGRKVAPQASGFAISELVARIEAFTSGRDDLARPPKSDEPEPEPEATPDAFRFETDATGVVIGVDGVARGALVGLSVVHSAVQGAAQLDGVFPGAFRRRSRLDGARLEVGGASGATGSWRLSAVPAFDPATGRFTGYRGVGRRPRADESAALPVSAPSPDSLRQLVHELRTPTNAIAGFAELIESELLGPVADPYRARAAEIRARATDLLVAIEDLDTASRIEMGVLDLRPGPVEVGPLMERALAELAPLVGMRGLRVVVDGDEEALARADHRAAERVVGRLLATLVAAGTPDETLRVSVYAGPSSIGIAVDRPRALQDLDADALLSLDAGEEAAGSPLLGIGFALRVARNLAGELDGSLELGPRRLTLRLPAAEGAGVEHATIS